MNWDSYFIQLADVVAKKAKDSTKVGVVLINPHNHAVLSTGYNGFPRGVTERVLQRPEKYAWTEHAERNAVYNAAKLGHSLDGAIAYMNWEPLPCVDCARAFIQAGVREIIGPARPFSTNNDWNFDISITMLEEAGVTIKCL